MSQLILCLYYLVALLAAYILLKAYRKNTSLGHKIVRVMLATVFIIIFYSFNLWTDHYTMMSLGNSLSFIMLDLMVVAFYDYMLEFLDYEERVSKWLRRIMIGYVIIDGMIFIENVYAEIANEYRVVPFYDTNILVVVPKVPFHMHIMFLCIVLLIIIALMVMKLVESPRSYRKKYYCLIVGITIAILTNVSHLHGFLDVEIDISVIAYGILGILMYFNTFYYNTVVNRDITRNLLLDYLSEPILLFDYEGRLSEASENMFEIFPSYCLKPKIHLWNFFEVAHIDGIKDIGRNQTIECTFMVEGKERHYDCRFSCMRDKKDKVVGYTIIFHDITSIQDAYYALEQSITHDALTGLFNKQSFDTQLPQWEDDRYWPVSVCVCNIDNIKKINQEHGIQYGDYIIKQFAGCVKKYVGTNNFIARVDGGDIVAMIERTGEAEAASIFEKIKEEVKTLDASEDISLEYGIVVVDINNMSVRDSVNEATSSMRRKKMLKKASGSSSLVDSLKQTLTESDFETEEHVERTQQMAARLGREMNLSDTEIAKLELLAVLHDIGKVAIPQHVLSKRGKLTPEERKIIQQHTEKGYRIAKSSPELAEIADGILSHHEKWDGTGYPNGLAGEEIPLLARIISAVDSHDVMVHNRPYHTAMPERDAIEELKRCAGTQFDPHVIEVFVGLLEREEVS